VTKFAAMRIQEIFENMPLTDFQQEYECATMDEQVAWLPWDLIKSNQDEGLVFWQAHSVEEALPMIHEMALAVREKKLEDAFAGGMDIGRKRDLTEIVLLGKATTEQLPYRLGISLSGVPFDDQKAVVDTLLEALPVTQFLVDQTGIGMQLAEQLHATHGSRVEGVTFSAPTNELWAVELKVRMERHAIPLPLDRELSYQLHSVKRKMTAAKNAVFDTEANEKHHADKFWALALAAWAGASANKRTSGIWV
jgi:phage FluMu gp28-like protein